MDAAIAPSAHGRAVGASEKETPRAPDSMLTCWGSIPTTKLDMAKKISYLLTANNVSKNRIFLLLYLTGY
ncbi:MAG: hypothetical protein ABW098_11740 [Candidatus Thiodiazotropha sp.]